MHPVLLKRRILSPWLLSALTMMGLSYAWHGWALTDISELHMDLWQYLVLSGVAYLAIALVLTLAVHVAVAREWISMKSAFHGKTMLIGAVYGLGIYLVLLVSGLSFADHGIQHVALDLVWQVIEQSVGGLMVGLGIIYDLHRNFMEAERAK